ncbi:MAG: hypothetical protein JWN40_2838 [Phycisphaerales bacterium]|nr:hypothetical protein [Phycisphaerales bacterium]
MTPEQFVQLAKNERDQFLAMCFDSPPQTVTATKIAAMNLSPEQQRLLRDGIASLLTDVFYTWLLALDGCASFGGQQRDYVLKDEDGSLLTDCDKIECAAYEALHGDAVGEV